MFDFLNQAALSDVLPAGHDAMQFVRQWAKAAVRAGQNPEFADLPPSQASLAKQIVDEIESREARPITRLSSDTVDSYIRELSQRLQETVRREFAVDVEKGRSILNELRPNAGSRSELKKLAIVSQRHMRDHDWERAKSKLTDAIIVCKQIGDRQTQANLSCNLGLVYERLGDKGTAKQLHLQALQIDTELDYQEGIANHLYNLARLAFDDSDHIDAESKMTEARQIYAQLGLDERVADAGEWLERITKP